MKLSKDFLSKVKKLLEEKQPIEETQEKPKPPEPKKEEKNRVAEVLPFVSQEKLAPPKPLFGPKGEDIEPPIIIEFPRIGSELNVLGTIPDEERKVRHAPEFIHKIPKERLLGIIPSEWHPPNLKDVNITYPLIEPFAYAKIYWNDEEGSLKYEIIEPPLSVEEQAKLKKIEELIIDLLDINLMEVKDPDKIKNYLKEKTDQIIKDYGMYLTDVEYNKILYYIYRDFIGLGKIEPLMKDVEIEDISCDGAGIPIYIFHRKYGSMKSNVVFENPEELNNFIIKLAQRCGKHVSVAEPILDGALPDGSRVSATYSPEKDIAIKGSTFTIRKFTKDPLTITDLINFGTLPPLIAAYLWMAIEFKKSLLISGGTATGKTSFLNALCMFIEPEAKIVSIEDTPELNLPHEHWIAKIARPGYSTTSIGEVSMFDLLKAALRERPDYIIVGEVRGAEAYVLFQAMATGHAGLATIHAESIDAVMNRLQTPPINLSPGLIQHLDLVLIMTHARIKGIDVRRLKEVIEIVDIDIKTGKPIINQLFRWNPVGDYFEFSSDRSYIINAIIEEKGLSEESVWAEIRRREKVLEWLKENNIRYYKDVGKIISEYYKNPEKVLERIEGNIHEVFGPSGDKNNGI